MIDVWQQLPGLRLAFHIPAELRQLQSALRSGVQYRSANPRRRRALYNVVKCLHRLDRFAGIEQGRREKRVYPEGEVMAMRAQSVLAKGLQFFDGFLRSAVRQRKVRARKGPIVPDLRPCTAHWRRVLGCQTIQIGNT